MTMREKEAVMVGGKHEERQPYRIYQAESNRITTSEFPRTNYGYDSPRTYSGTAKVPESPFHYCPQSVDPGERDRFALG
jgi:hypothetical protein